MNEDITVEEIKKVPFTIFIVEDNEALLSLLRKNLEREGFLTEGVSSGSEAIAWITGHHSERLLMLIDYLLPDMSGKQVIETLQEQHCIVPFIIMTGHGDLKDAVEIMKLGALDYFEKSNDFLQLLPPVIKKALKQLETEKKLFESQTALLESEKRYKRLVESVTDYIYTVWIDNGNPVATSHGPNCVAVTGYTAEEYEADPLLWYRMIHEEDRGAVTGQAAKVLSGVAVVPLEHRIIHKNGSIRWVRNTPVLRYNQQGSLIAYDGLIADITERKKIEEELLLSKKDWEDTFNTINDMITIHDRDFNIIRANKVTEKILELPSLQIGKTKCYTLFHRTDRPPEECPSCQCIKTGEPVTVEIYERHLNMHIEIKAIPRFDSNNELTGLIHIARNITESKKLEDQLRQAQKMEAVGQLAGGVAHDFNNILTAIMGYANFLCIKMKQGDQLRKYAEQIVASSQKAADFIQDLLAFSRKQMINPEPVKINEIIKGIEKLLLRLIREDIELKIIPSEEDITIMADRVQIETILMNLVTNAKDAMPEGGVLTIGTEPVLIDAEFIKVHGYGQEGRYALVSVTDTGIGMDNKTRKQIFEPFFTTKETGKGTGLGLSVVYGIVKQHDGYIDVYSEPYAGTTFKMYFPATKAEIKEVEDNEFPAIIGGTETVLVAEDNRDVRWLIKDMLEEHGYDVIEAVDGEDALNKYRRNKGNIQLLILDVIMPKKNGLETYEEIKKNNSDIEALFMSGYTADIINRRGIPRNELNFIPKPISPDKLLRKVREVIDKFKEGKEILKQ